MYNSYDYYNQHYEPYDNTPFKIPSNTNLNYQTSITKAIIPEKKEETVVLEKVKRYFDITSASRNRLIYPSVCDFVIPVNIQSKVTPIESTDPIINGFPYEYNTLSASTNPFAPLYIRLNVSSVSINDFYTNSFIEIGGEFRKIVSYNGSTFSAKIDLPFTILPLVGTSYTLRKELPVIRTTIVASVNNQITLSPLASSISNIYTNNYIFIGTIPSNYQWRLITYYDGATRTLTYDGPLVSLVGPDIEILLFTRDNVVPLLYSSSSTDSSSTSQLMDSTKSLYYEIRLQNI